jgi:hypothetical protein
MGFMLSSFLGGAATQAVTSIEAREKEARDTGLLAGKSLYAQYAAIKKENADYSSDIKDNLEVIKTAWPTLDEKTATEMASRKSVMGAVTAMVKDGTVDPKLVDINMFRKFAETNAPEVAIDKMKQTADIGTMVKGMITSKETDAALTEKKPKGMMEEYYDSYAKSGATAYAASVGIPIEEMKNIKRLSEKPMDTSISFDLTQLRAAKKSGDMEDAAKAKYIQATRSGDPKAIEAATADLAIFQSMKEVLTTAQQQQLEKVAVLKSIIITGGPEATKAQTELNKVWAMDKAEKQATSIKEPKDGAGAEKTPALGSLESFTSKAVTRTVETMYGKKLGKDLITTVTPDGVSTIKYIGNDPIAKAQVDATKAMAADRALSLYPQDSTAVMSIKQSYRTLDKEEPAPAEAAPTSPQSTAQKLGLTSSSGTPVKRSGGLGSRPAAPAATLLPPAPAVSDIDERLKRYK